LKDNELNMHRLCRHGCSYRDLALRTLDLEAAPIASLSQLRTLSVLGLVVDPHYPLMMQVANGYIVMPIKGRGVAVPSLRAVRVSVRP
jgi:hypothetical protein